MNPENTPVTDAAAAIPPTATEVIGSVGIMESERWYLYLIETVLGHYYCGITTNVERRFQEHQGGGRLAARSLRGKGPLQLRFYAKAGDRRLALRLEYRVKRLARKDKQRLIRGDLTLSSLLDAPASR